MSITYAPNGIYLGAALGLMAGLATHNAGVGIVVAIAGSVAGWYGIRLIETLLSRGVSAGVTAVSNAVSARRSAAPGPHSPSPAPPQGAPNYPPAGYHGYPNHPDVPPNPMGQYGSQNI